jgi:Response regulator containing CheY-like receiver, AAA-type ATPase, and DNA-binding domains
VASIPLQSDALPWIVLIVGSDEALLTSYSGHFERAGLWVAVSTSPMEAIEAVRELRPDLVVTTTFDDAECDLVVALKSGALTAHVPVILLTSQSDENPMSVELADMCLQAPVPSSRLLSCSKELIARSRDVKHSSEPVRPQAHQLVVTSSDTTTAEQPHATRSCPKCGKRLEWIEHGRLNGVDYDYYRWCTTGCGLYCYERRAETWIKLA